MAGEWSDNDEGLAWKAALTAAIQQITDEVPEFILESVHGFDMYQGPYAWIQYDGRSYKVWTTEEDRRIWIEGFPVDNTSGAGTLAGFEGEAWEIVEMLQEIERCDECGAYIPNTNPSMLSADHVESCSLYEAEPKVSNT